MIIDHARHNEADCTICGEHTRAPFLEWFCTHQDKEVGETPNIAICPKCCSKIAYGLIADLLVMKAKHDIEHLTGRSGLHVRVKDFDHVLAERKANERLEIEIFCRDYDEQEDGASS
jgi:hypothetical protein